VKAQCTGLHAGLFWRNLQGTFTNLTHTGMLTCKVVPVGVRRPVVGSIRKRTMLFEFWFAAMSQDPVGSIPKLRGVLPWVDTCSTGVSVPFAWSMVKTAMLSWPRFEP
jgi:hypothetical protein